MARALVTCALVALLAVAALARAQDSDAGVMATRARVVRPPEGSLRRGRLPLPGWAVGLTGGALSLGAAGWLIWRASRRR